MGGQGRGGCNDLMKIKNHSNIWNQNPSNFGRLYDDFLHLFFLHAHREASALAGALPEESDQFRSLRTTCLFNRKGSVGLHLVEDSGMGDSIPIDLSTRSFIPLLRFFRSRRVSPLLTSPTS
jgi:hypothetical protein